MATKSPRLLESKATRMLQEMDNEAQDLLNFLEGLECKRSTHTLEITSKYDDHKLSEDDDNCDEDSTTQQIRTSLAERRKFYQEMEILSNLEDQQDQVIETTFTPNLVENSDNYHVNLTKPEIKTKPRHSYTNDQTATQKAVILKKNQSFQCKDNVRTFVSKRRSNNCNNQNKLSQKINMFQNRIEEQEQQLSVFQSENSSRRGSHEENQELQKISPVKNIATRQSSSGHDSVLYNSNSHSHGTASATSTSGSENSSLERKFTIKQANLVSTKKLTKKMEFQPSNGSKNQNFDLKTLIEGLPEPPKCLMDEDNSNIKDPKIDSGNSASSPNIEKQFEKQVIHDNNIQTNLPQIDQFKTFSKELDNLQVRIGQIQVEPEIITNKPEIPAKPRLDQVDISSLPRRHRTRVRKVVTE